MAVKVLIKRTVPRDKAKVIVPLFKQLRILAMNQPGYISGETLKKLDSPVEFLVVSTWQSSQDWEKWQLSEARTEIQAKMDSLLGGETEYEIFHYGFGE